MSKDTDKAVTIVFAAAIVVYATAGETPMVLMFMSGLYMWKTRKK